MNHFSIPGRSLASFSVAFLLCLCSCIARCQVLPLQYYTTREGLVANHITALYQNSLGYLWIGTADGLSVYDGATFTNYTTVDGLAHNYVTCVAESRRTPGKMWIGTLGGGISEFRDGHFTTFSVAAVDSRNSVGAILEDSMGTVWCGTYNGLCLIREGQVVPFGRRGKIESASIVQISGHRICVALDRVVSVYSTDGTLIMTKVIPASATNYVTSVLADRDGTLWLAVSDSTIFHIKDTVVIGRMKCARGAPVELLEDHAGNIFCDSWEGVFRFSKAAFPRGDCTKYSVANGLRELISLPITLDREDNIWIGSWSKGLAKLAAINLFSLPNPDGEQSFMAIPDRNDHIWIATGRSLWEVFQDGSGQWKQYRQSTTLASPAILPGMHLIHFDPRGRLWERTGEPPTLRCYEVSSLSGYPSRLRVVHTLRSGVDFPRGEIIAFAVDTKDHLWCSVPRAGVADVDLSRKNRTRIYDAHDDLPAGDIPVVYEDRSGDVWLGGFQGGLSKISKVHTGHELIKHYSVSDGLPDNCVRSLLQDREGRMWVGTRYGGLAVIRDSAIRTISIANGLLNNAIWCIAQDDSGRIWVGTDNGMDCLDQESLHPMLRNDELLGERVYSCSAIRGGVLWYLTRYGLTFYNYSIHRTNQSPPPIYITRFLVNGKETGQHNLPEFSYDENDCQFDFVGISLKDEKAVRYEYRLQNVDRDWHSSTQRSVTFAALRPGSYVFEVRAINNDDVRSLAPASVSFVIAPPYWQRTWFIAAMILFLFALLYSVYRYRVQRVVELERLRLRIASDLHDDVGTNLSSIVLASQIMERKFPLSADEQKELSQVRSTASQTQEMMRDIVWMLNPQNDSLDDFLRKMKEVASRLLVGIPHTFNAPKEQRLDRLGLEFKRSILLIFKETLNNIVRHSSATHVSIEVRDEDGVFSLFVQDNGVGFEPGTTRTAGSGLASLRRRAEGIGGTITIVSSSGEGTAVQLSAKIT